MVTTCRTLTFSRSQHFPAIGNIRNFTSEIHCSRLTGKARFSMGLSFPSFKMEGEGPDQTATDSRANSE